MNENLQLLKLLYNQDSKISRIYTAMANDLGLILKAYKFKNGKDTWYNNKVVEKEVNKLFTRYQSVILKHITSNIDTSWDMSNDSYDEVVKDYLKGQNLTKNQISLFNNRGYEALKAHKSRVQGGLKISDRVWNLTKQNKEHIGYFLKEGLSEGRSANQIATDLQQYLKDPNKRFRRVRDKKTGKLKLSQPAKSYHPGQGVYRNSFQNALRLSRNEINIAYKSADFERRNKLPFVTGVEIHLSGAHPRYDICDELVGKYPKDFKFHGWHVNCLCFTTNVLLPKKDFKKYQSGDLNINRRGVRSIPKNAKNYISSLEPNKVKKLEFVKDNKSYFSPAKTPKEVVVDSNNLKSFISGFQSIGDSQSKKILFEYARLFPEDFKGGLANVSFSKNMRGMMSNGRSYYANGTHAVSRGNKLSINKSSYRIDTDNVFSPGTDFTNALNKIKEGSVLSFNEEYSLESMWHEIQHAKAKGWGNSKNRTNTRVVSMETINQYTARYSYDGFVKKLGGEATHKASVMDKGYGYTNYINNFRNAFKKYGYTEKEAYEYFKDLIFDVPYEDIHGHIIEFFVKKNVTRLEANKIVIGLSSNESVFKALIN